jgi:hypothetical protein
MQIGISEIWGLIGLVGATVNSKGLVDLVVGKFKIEGISLAGLKLLENDDAKRIDIIKKIFVDRQIMWKEFDKETISLCINSLQTLIDFCEQEGRTLMESHRDDNQFYGKLLMQLSSYAMRSIHEFRRAQEQIVFLNATARFNDEMSQEWDWIPDILKAFRFDALPIIKIFIDLLSPKAPQRAGALVLFDQSMKILIEHHQVAYSEILKPYWDYKAVLS